MFPGSTFLLPAYQSRWLTISARLLVTLRRLGNFVENHIKVTRPQIDSETLTLFSISGACLLIQMTALSLFVKSHWVEAWIRIHYASLFQYSLTPTIRLHHWIHPFYRERRQHAHIPITGDTTRWLMLALSHPGHAHFWIGMTGSAVELFTTPMGFVWIVTMDASVAGWQGRNEAGRLAERRREFWPGRKHVMDACSTSVWNEVECFYSTEKTIV